LVRHTVLFERTLTLTRLDHEQKPKSTGYVGETVRDTRPPCTSRPILLLRHLVILRPRRNLSQRWTVALDPITRQMIGIALAVSTTGLTIINSTKPTSSDRVAHWHLLALDIAAASAAIHDGVSEDLIRKPDQWSISPFLIPICAWI